MEFSTNSTIIFANTRTPMNEDLHSGDLPMVELSSPNKWDPHNLKFPKPTRSYEEFLNDSVQFQISALKSEPQSFADFDVDLDFCSSKFFI